MHTTPSSSQFTLAKCMAATVLAGVVLTSESQAVLRATFDIRAVESGSNGVVSSGISSISPDGRNVVFAPGAQIVLQLVATLNATDADLSNDSFTRADGSWISSLTTGNLTGSFRSDALTAAGINNLEPFKGTGAKSGTNTGNLSNPADGILDLGGSSTSAFTGYFTASANSPTGITGQSFILGETVLTLGGTGSTAINFVPRLATTGLTGNKASFTFKVDNVSYQFRGDGAVATQSGGAGDATTFAFNGVTLTAVPEPSAFGMVILGAMGLIGFRRVGLR